MRVVVIGSGVAGLTAAAYLAQRGHQVIVFEQYSEIGGVTATIKHEGFKWDLGPMLLEGFGYGEPAADILDELGIYTRVSFIREDRGAVFPDFSIWKQKEYEGPYWRREYLKKLFPHDRKGLNKYYLFYDRVMDMVAYYRQAERSKGLKNSYFKTRALMLYLSIKKYADNNAQQIMDEMFHSLELKFLFTAILADFVVKPSEFPALGVPFLNIETPFDKRMPLQVSKAGPRPSYHYVKNGCENLVSALSSVVLLHKGSIYTRKAVSKIEVDDGCVTGVHLEDGTHVQADLVIASGGVKETYYGLLGMKYLPPEFIAKIENVALMESVHMVHLISEFNPLLFQPAALCYYYGSYNVEEAIANCRSGDYHEGKDGFLIYIPSLHSPEMASEGKHAVTVYTIAPNKLSQGSWSGRAEELTDKLLESAEKYMPPLRAKSRVVEIMTPMEFRKRTNLLHHAFGGRAPIMGKKGGPHRAPVAGLWFVGSQSEKEGGGVVGTMQASKKVVKLILDG